MTPPGYIGKPETWLRLWTPTGGNPGMVELFEGRVLGDLGPVLPKPAPRGPRDPVRPWRRDLFAPWKLCQTGDFWRLVTSPRLCYLFNGISIGALAPVTGAQPRQVPVPRLLAWVNRTLWLNILVSDGIHAGWHTTFGHPLNVPPCSEMLIRVSNNVPVDIHITLRGGEIREVTS